MVVSGYYKSGLTLPSDNISTAMAKVVEYVHLQVLQSHQAVNAILQYTTDAGGENTVHIIGSRYSGNRGRYIAMTRTEDNMYSYRFTDSGIVARRIQLTDDIGDWPYS